jgi:hypothetical protein
LYHCSTPWRERHARQEQEQIVLVREQTGVASRLACLVSEFDLTVVSV